MPGSYYNDYHGLSSIHIRIGFTISTDVPSFSGGAVVLLLRHRNAEQVHIKTIEAPDELRYAVVYAMSDNYWKIFSLEKVKRLLGYEPQDGAGETFTPEPTLEHDLTEYKMRL